METDRDSEPSDLPRREGRAPLRFVRFGIAVAAGWLLLAVLLLPRYGPTVDETNGEFPYGEGLLHWIESSDVTLEQTLVHPVAPPTRAPHPEFVDTQPWTDVWPLASFLSALSCRWCWTKMGWLGAVAAHHLPAPLFVAVLLAAMVAWMARRAGPFAAIGAAACLLTSPRFFFDAISNVKDAPEAALYVVAWLAVGRAVGRGTLRSWAVAAALAGAALAQKANALFLAPQGLALLAVVACTRREAPTGATGGRSEPARRPLWLALPVAFAVFASIYFALSPQLWIDPVDHVARMYHHVLENGSRVMLESRRTVEFEGHGAAVSFEGVNLVAWTTPPVVLLLALAGLFTRRLSPRDRLFLLIGVAVPVGRTLLPGNVNFDGVRHFHEFMPCLALLAGAGLDGVTRALARPLAARSVRTAAVARVAAALALIAPGAVATVRTEPNGLAWFNGLIGGLAGAQARGLPDATDWWGNSYWQALDWLDEHAEPGAAVRFAIYPAIVRSVAHYRLRPDLVLARYAKTPPHGPLYVVYVTRRNWYDRTLREIDATEAKIHEILVDGAPILRIIRFDAGEPTRAVLDRFTRSALAANLRERISAWSLKDATARAELAAILRSSSDDEAQKVARLRQILPPELHEGLEDLVRELEPAH